MPQFGMGVYMVPEGPETENAVAEARPLMEQGVDLCIFGIERVPLRRWPAGRGGYSPTSKNPRPSSAARKRPT